MTGLTEDSKKFFKYWREQYEWPRNSDRKASEERIFRLLEETREVLSIGKKEDLQKILVKIHMWKTRNRSGTSDKYERELLKNTRIIAFLQNNFPLKSSKVVPKFYERLLETLKINYCNLPTCSAQASVLLNRSVPILDRFVAQFFGFTMSKKIVEYDKLNMSEVLKDIHPTKFMIEDDGTSRCTPRLAVYQSTSYQKNKDLFVSQLIPELVRISGLLNESEVYYSDIFGYSQKFTCVDVEMAVFAFSTQNVRFFKCFYKRKPTRLCL